VSPTQRELTRDREKIMTKRIRVEEWRASRRARLRTAAAAAGATAALAAVLIAANWGAGDGPSYPSGRQPSGVSASHAHRMVAARKGPPLPAYVVPLGERTVAYGPR
jgi:hypothetical protein